MEKQKPRRCRHKYETLQQTIRNGQIYEEACRCVKCGMIREMREPKPKIEITWYR